MNVSFLNQFKKPEGKNKANLKQLKETIAKQN